MDPLSVAASITGLFTASIEVIKLFAALKGAYDYAQTIHDEIHHFRFILFQLYKYVYSQSMNVARGSMIDLDQVVSVIMGCMFTFSELEREAKRLKSRAGALGRVWWVMARSTFVDLVQRLQNHKGTICSMLAILTSGTHDEALNAMHDLQRQVAELERINGERARNLAPPSASTSGASIAGSSTRSVLSFSSARTNFSITLKNSRVYKRALSDHVNKPRPATSQGPASSIEQAWSVLSGISLSEVSNYAVYSLHIPPKVIYNPTWYTKPHPIESLESNTPEVPALLTKAFAEDLKNSLKHGDVETAKSIANYIPWNLVVKMSAAYPMLAADPSNRNSLEEELDRLTLLRLWLQCGGDVVSKNRWGQTLIQEAIDNEDWVLFKLLCQNGSDINSALISGSNALHLVSGVGSENLVLGLCEDIEKDRAMVSPVGPGLLARRGWAVEILLGLGATVDATNWNEETALHLAAGSGYREVVEILLSHGADANANDYVGETPLDLARARGYQDVVEVLLSNADHCRGQTPLLGEIFPRGESPLWRESPPWSEAPPWKETPPHQASDGGHKDADEALPSQSTDDETALHEASACGHKYVIEVLLSHGVNVNTKAEKGVTPLHHASVGGHKDIVEVLLSHGADVKAKTYDGRTALHGASAGGHKDVVEVLLRHGADVNTKAEKGVTPLHQASAGGHKDVIEVLLSHGAYVNTRAEKGVTPLHQASVGGHKDVVELLLSHRADVEAHNLNDGTALYGSSARGHKDVVEVLLSHGADVKANPYNTGTALHAASAGGHKDIVEVLLSHGADVKAKTHGGRTALRDPSAGGHKDIVEILLSHGVDVKAKTDDGGTALHDASAGGHKDIVEALLSHGADVKAKTYDGGTALHGASAGGHKDVVEVLLSHGADVKARNEEGGTSLLGASAGAHKDVVEVLLIHGADVNAKDHWGATPIHVALVRGHKDVVEVLLSHGADVKAKNKDDGTALRGASAPGHKDVVEVLFSHGADVKAKTYDGGTAFQGASAGEN